MDSKKWYTSKTLWFNAVTILLGFIAVINQTFPFDAEFLALLNGFGNVILRFLTTKPLA